MFLQVSVCPQGGVVSQHALQVSRPTPRGEVEGSGLGGSPGPHPGGSSGTHVGEGVSRPTPGGVSQHALRQTPPQQTTTAAGGTHPTGMHSCFIFRLRFVDTPKHREAESETDLDTDKLAHNPMGIGFAVCALWTPLHNSIQIIFYLSLY